jgi:hypothetical protein
MNNHYKYRTAKRFGDFKLHIAEVAKEAQRDLIDLSYLAMTAVDKAISQTRYRRNVSGAESKTSELMKKLDHRGYYNCA